jgi:hypothetical protein
MKELLARFCQTQNVQEKEALAQNIWPPTCEIVVRMELSVQPKLPEENKLTCTCYFISTTKITPSKDLNMAVAQYLPQSFTEASEIVKIEKKFVAILPCISMEEVNSDDFKFACNNFNLGEVPLDSREVEKLLIVKKANLNLVDADELYLSEEVAQLKQDFTKQVENLSD